MSSDQGEHDYTAHFTREELEERRQKGELDVDPDSLVLPPAHNRILKYLSRADNPEDFEPFDRVREEGVMQAMRRAVATDDRASMAAFRGFKQAQRSEDELIPMLMNRLGQEAMTTYTAATTDSGKTHLLLLMCQIAVDLSDYEAFVTNVPLEAETKGTRLDVGGGFVEHDGVAVPARWDMEGRVPELEWQADPDLVKVFLDWHQKAGLPLTEIVATTEEHARAVAEYISGRVFMAVDEYGTSGGGYKGESNQEDRDTVQFVRAIRKDPWNASISIVGHSATDIPPDLRALVKLGIEKENKQTATFYENATRKGFEGQLGAPFEVPGHRLDDYNDKVQPPWKFKPRDDEDDEEDNGSEGPSKVDDIRAVLRVLEEDGKQKVAAAAGGVSEATVTRWKKKYELVEDEVVEK